MANIKFVHIVLEEDGVIFQVDFEVHEFDG